jgi:hypothetical protein
LRLAGGFGIAIRRSAEFLPDYLMCLTVVLLPLGLMLFNRVWAVLTLQRNSFEQSAGPPVH